MQWFPKTKLGKVNLALTILLIISLGCFFVLANLHKDGQTLAGAVQKISQDVTKSKESSDSKVSVKTEESEFDGIYYTTETSKADHYTLMYPKTRYAAVDNAIKESVYAKRDDFLSGETKKLVMSIKSSTSGDYITFLVKQKELLADKSTTTTVQSFTYDQKNHQLITVEDFVKSKERLKRLAKAVRTNLKDNKQVKSSAKELNTFTAAKWANFSTFALEGNNMKVYYQPNTVTDSLMAVTLPFTVMNKHYDKPIFDLAAHGKKYIAITFDDGPSETVTPRVLKILKQHDAKATFFMLGQSVQNAPDMAKAVAKAGHEIGNHSYKHDNLSIMSASQAVADITKTNKIIEKVTGSQPLTVRPPYGARNHGLEQQSAQPMVLWSIDTLDWKTLNPTATLSAVQKMAYPGAIVLMHDIHATTADALDSVLTYLEDEGYEFVTVSELEGKQ